MIPLEMVTMLGSGLLAGVLALFAQSMKAKQDANKMLIARATQQEVMTENARNMKGVSFTRRTIAIMTVFSVIVLPMLAPMFFYTDVTVGYTEWNPGFWFFTEGSEVVKWKEVTSDSLVITPLHTHLVSAITGFYFGNKVGR